MGDFRCDQKGAEFLRTGTISSGAGRQITPVTVNAVPASGSCPTDYLIVNVTDGALMRNAGSLTWEIQVGVGTASKVGLLGSTAVGQRTSADQAIATDLANELRTVLVKKGPKKWQRLSHVNSFS